MLLKTSTSPIYQGPGLISTRLRPAWCWNEGFRVTPTTTLTLAGEARHHSLMSTPKHIWVFVEPAPQGLAFAPQLWLPRHPQNLLFTAACIFTSSWVRTLSLHHLTCVLVSCGSSSSWFWCAKSHVWTKKILSQAWSLILMAMASAVSSNNRQPEEEKNAQEPMWQLVQSPTLPHCKNRQLDCVFLETLSVCVCVCFLSF